MNRTKMLQEIRQMRFVEAYAGWQARRLTQGKAPTQAHASELQQACH